jgi:hypothetical protein
MQDDFPHHEDELKSAWKNQPEESPNMTLEKIFIRQKVRELHTGNRRKLIGQMSAAVVFLIFSADALAQTHNLALRVAVGFSMVWMIAGQYFLQRGMWSGTPPSGMAFSTGLEFYRRELTRRRDLFRRRMLWAFGPVVLALAAWIAVAVDRTNWLFLSKKAAPFFTLLALWFVGVFVLRSRERGNLRREMDDLQSIEKETSRRVVS